MKFNSIVPVASAAMAMFIANLYYAQPLAGIIAQDIGLPITLSGFLISASQFGYAAGLLVIVPLGDAFEYRRLTLTCSGMIVVGLIGQALAHGPMTFIASGALTGFFSAGAQILVPYLAHILPERDRGRLLGYAIGSALLAVMFARPVALFVAGWTGWRTLYAASAALALVLLLLLRRTMHPLRMPTPLRSGPILWSMAGLLLRNTRVRRRIAYQAPLFACFTMFWAVTPIMLSQRFGLGPFAIGIFALVGAGGVTAAPLAGRLSDNGQDRQAMRVALIAMMASFLLAIWAVNIGSLALLAIAAILIDGAAQATQTFSRLIVLDVAPEVRARILGGYMTIVYSCGAMGSLAGISCYFHFGWLVVGLIGVLIPFAVLIATFGEARRHASTAIGSLDGRNAH